MRLHFARYALHTFQATLCALHKNATFANLLLFFFIEFTIREIDCEIRALRTCETDDTRHSCTLTNSIIDIGH